MTTLDLILTCVGGVIFIIGAILSSIFGNGYNKEKKNSNNLINYINIILDILPNLMQKYEEIFKNGKGTEKETLVLNETIKYCVDNNIQYNEDLVKKAIDTLINVSKTINKK